MSGGDDIRSWEEFWTVHVELAERIRRAEWAAAIPLLEGLAGTGDVRAASILGECYLLGLGVERDTEEGVRLLRDAAERGSAVAAHNLATAFLSGAEILCACAFPGISLSNGDRWRS
jgi:TPR repeat protein